MEIVMIAWFLGMSFMSVMDEKENNVKVQCFDLDTGKPTYTGIVHITKVPKIGNDLNSGCIFSKESEK